ncbi:MAG: ABC transporter ATP-binding protein [Ornithinimicrobium sp.]
MSAELVLDRLTYRHPGNREDAVQGLSLTVPAGSMLALLGASGSGKSTTLRLTGGLVTPRSGDVRLDGASLAGVAPQRRGMSMMFQKPLLFPHLSVVDNVAFADRVAGLSRRQARHNAARYLDLVHLSELASRRSRELSGGQEQRVALARALAVAPQVLLLDEPFGALDTAVRESMYDLLEEVRAVVEPTIVLVTHDLAEASLADEVAVLCDGRVLQKGTVRALHEAPATVDVARLLGGFTELAGTVRNGMHLSPAGRVSLPDHCRVPDGPATVLLHRQAVRVQAVDRESRPDVDDDGATLAALVTRVRSAGLHRRLNLALAPDSQQADAAPTLEADIGTDADAAERLIPGDRVVVRIVGPGPWAVAGVEPSARQHPGVQDDLGHTGAFTAGPA